jgi:hypothetical protein
MHPLRCPRDKRLWGSLIIAWMWVVLGVAVILLT